MKAPTRIKVLIQIITFKTKEETTHKLNKKHTLKLTWDMQPKTLGFKALREGERYMELAISIVHGNGVTKAHMLLAFSGKNHQRLAV